MVLLHSHLPLSLPLYFPPCLIPGFFSALVPKVISGVSKSVMLVLFSSLVGVGVFFSALARPSGVRGTVWGLLLRMGLGTTGGAAGGVVESGQVCGCVEGEEE